MFPNNALKQQLFYHHYMFMTKKDDDNNIESETNDEEDNQEGEEDSPVNQLFPKKKSNVNSTSNHYFTIPEFLSFGTMLLFIAGVALLASYQSFTKKKVDDIHFNVRKLMDIPENVIYDEVKLPKNIKPLNYVIYLYPNLKFRNMTGVVKVTFQCIENSTDIVIHSSKHSVNRIELKNMSGGNIEITNIVRNEKRGYLILSLKTALVSSLKYDLFLGFYKTLEYNPSGGVYLSQYLDVEMKTNLILTSMFEPTFARYAFPCFDEPNLKAVFKIIVRHNSSDGYKAIANMPVEKRITVTETDVETHFEQTPLMSTYLIAITVCNYGYKETYSKYGVPIRVYAPKDRLKEVDFAIKVAPLALDFYVDKLGMNYTLPKLDLISVTDLISSGEENWGLISLREMYVLYNENITSSDWVPNIATSITHEISHLWFGDLVTPTWWRDMWLKESFAEYMEYLPINQYFPQFDLKTSFYKTNNVRAMTTDLGNYSHPLFTDETDPVILETYYDDITYLKGVAILSMLSDFLGDEDFFKGINYYLKEHEYGNANVTQFWQAISAVQNNTNIAEMMNQWTVKTSFPLITLKIEKGKLYTKQERFEFSDKVNNESSFWHVPLLVGFQDNDIIFRFHLKNLSDSYSLSSLQNKPSWYKANYGASGYYIVNYEDENWIQLLNIFNTDHLILSAVDRANILSDLTFIENSGRRRINLTLEFTKYLKKERHYIPWEMGIKQVELIESVFRETEIGTCLKGYILDLTSHVLGELSLYKNHSFLEQQLINVLVRKAVHYGKNDIIIQLQNLFLKWLIAEGGSELPSNLRSVILRVGVENGNSNIWEKLLSILKTTMSQNDRGLIIDALASTKNSTILQRMTNKITGISLLGESGYIAGLAKVCSNKYGRDNAWRDIKNNWNWISERNSADEIKYLVESCFSLGPNIDAAYLEINLEKLDDLLDNYEVGPFKRSLYQVKEKMMRTIEFRKRKDEIAEWMEINMPGCFL